MELRFWVSVRSRDVLQGRVRWGPCQLRGGPFLPPYCPNDNKIERVWQDLHANVTRNHTCPDITALMREVRYYLRKRNRRTLRKRSENTTKRSAA